MKVAGPTEFGEIPAALSGLGVWLYLLVAQGWVVAAEGLWILIPAIALGGWTLCMRLKFSESSIERVIGPWHRHVDLDTLQSITFK